MISIRNRLVVVFLTIFMIVFSSLPVRSEPSWIFHCRPDSDLFRVMTKHGYVCVRYDSPAEAIDRAKVDDIVLILASEYPSRRTPMNRELWDKAKTKNLKLYVEFPEFIPAMNLGELKNAQWERGVIAADVSDSSLTAGSLLAIHDCHYYEVKARSPLIVMAKVAGYDHAVFGFPMHTDPILFKVPDYNAWVSVTQLSQFITARFAPYESWKTIWQFLLSDLSGYPTPALTWQSPVYPTYTKTDSLPERYEWNALQRGMDWFVHSRLLVHPSDEPKIESHLQEGYKESPSYAAGWMSYDARVLPSADLPIGDGSHGFLEGYSSRILSNGSQLQRIIRRTDCMAEAAMGLALGRHERITSATVYSEYAQNLMDYIYFTSSAQQGVRADVHHPAYGLIAWGITNENWERATYGDDMARVLLASMASASLLKSDRWDTGILKCLLGSLRTTGRFGFRRDCLTVPELEKNGWRYYSEESFQNIAPHYQAYLWACYLWAYHQTGYLPFLNQAKSAIRITMESYPDGWRWTNGIEQERARMLLPLSWLVRIEDTPEHRSWLRKMGEEMLALQQPCGALREELGKWENGTLRPPKSNEEYGTGETPLIQENGDPASDLLYSSNFAFLGLHEAAYATGDAFYRDAGNRLAEFLCRIQIRSERHPELDGGWFRAFDFHRWEYWASDADAGWGAWCIESGWTQGWITAVLGLRHMNTSLWDLTENSSIEKDFAIHLPTFFPEKE